MRVKTVQNIYRTSEAVPESGAYICAEGEIKLFKKMIFLHLARTHVNQRRGSP